MKMNFIEELTARGFFHQATNLDDLTKLFNTEKVSGYIGFDPTASSLHVGNLMQIMILRLLQKHGHRPIVIVGGGTVKVGDPSGKDEMRKLLNDEAIQNNLNGIKANLANFINFGERENDAIILNNDDWFKNIHYIDFLRNYGRYFSINRMLKFDSVKLRLEREQNLSFLEFNYMLLQAYDFVHLHQKYNCRLQFGGSDQWGNIVNGIELNHKLGLDEVYGLTSPLITTASGAKMGKSANGAVWLSSDLLSPYDYYQYWRNTDDRDVIKFMKIFTDLPLDKIEEYSKKEGSEINEIKKILAYETTRLCHGEQAAKEAQETAIKTFELGDISQNLPTLEMKIEEIEKGLLAYNALNQLKLCNSNGEGKRLIKGNGVKINDKTIEDENYLLTKSDINDGNIKISAGKKKHVLIKVIN